MSIYDESKRSVSSERLNKNHTLKIKKPTYELFKELVADSITTYASELVKNKECEGIEEAYSLAKEEVESLFDTESIDDLYFYVLFCNDKIIGYIWFDIIKCSELKTAFLLYIYVDKAYRRHSYAKYLMNFYQREMQLLGVKRSELYVFAKNHPAIALYLNQGYFVSNKAGFYRAQQQGLISRLKLVKYIFT